MTPEIRKLAEQCGIMFEASKQNRIHSVSTETLQRFSELIIEECAKVANRAWNDPGTYPGNLVKSHFDL